MQDGMYLASSSHDNLAHIVFFLDHRACEVTILVVRDPGPLLLVEFSLSGGGTSGLSAVRWSRSGQERMRPDRRKM